MPSNTPRVPGVHALLFTTMGRQVAQSRRDWKRSMRASQADLPDGTVGPGTHERYVIHGALTSMLVNAVATVLDTRECRRTLGESDAELHMRYACLEMERLVAEGAATLGPPDVYAEHCGWCGRTRRGDEVARVRDDDPDKRTPHDKHDRRWHDACLGDRLAERTTRP